MLYNAKLFLCSIGLAANLATGPSVAQDASSNFAECVAWKQDSTPRATELGNAFKCLVDKIDYLESELRPFKAARGAVVAFDRNRNTEAVCPRGWTYFHPAGGRFMVGAGEHENGLTEYPSHIEDNSQSVGGDERVALLEIQMPKHSHGVSDPGHAHNNSYGQVAHGNGISFPIFGDSGVGRPTKPAVTGITTMIAGGDEKHDNMPPYVALYFCKKN